MSRFYRQATGWTPAVDQHNYLELHCPQGGGIAIYDDASFRRNFGGADRTMSEPHRVELYIEVQDLATAAKAVVSAGGTQLSPPRLMDWGAVVQYFADPDRQVIALALARSSE